MIGISLEGVLEDSPKKRAAQSDEIKGDREHDAQEIVRSFVHQVIPGRHRARVLVRFKPFAMVHLRSWIHLEDKVRRT